MGGAWNLRASFLLGRVYRRRELASVTAAVDRDLKTLLDAGALRKVGPGMYCLPDSSGKPSAPLEEIVRVFVKTDDYLLVPPRRRADPFIVYNRRRAGELTLGERRVRFKRSRTVQRRDARGGASLLRDPAAARVLSKEGPRDDLDWWLSRSADDRVAAVELLREQYYATSCFRSLPRLARDVRLRDPRE